MYSLKSSTGGQNIYCKKQLMQTENCKKYQLKKNIYYKQWVRGDKLYKLKIK